MKYNIRVDHNDTDRVNEIELERIEICVDPEDIQHVWLYILDDNHERIEGAEFSMAKFMQHVRKFYDDNY